MAGSGHSSPALQGGNHGAALLNVAPVVCEGGQEEAQSAQTLFSFLLTEPLLGSSIREME